MRKRRLNIKNSIVSKTKLNSIEVLNFKTLIDLCSSHDESVSINNVLNQYDDIKEEIKNLKAFTDN